MRPPTTAVGPTAPPAIDRGRRLSVLVCSAAVFVVMLDGSIVNVALPTIAANIHADTSGLQWIVDGYLLVLACGLLSAGALGDRLGRRRVFLTGLVIFAIASCGASLAPNLATLVGFRLLQGLGGAMLPPSALAIIAHTFPDRRERARAMGIWGAVSGFAVATGPLVGGVLVSVAGWRAIFWVNVPVLAVALLATSRYVTDSRALHPRRLDLPGQFLAATGLATLTYALINAPHSGWTAPTTILMLAAAGTALGAFVDVERRRAQPMLPLGYFRDRRFSGAALVAILALFAVNGFMFVSTLYLQDLRHYSPLEAGAALLPASAVMVPLAPLAGRLTSTRGPVVPLVIATASMALGLLALTRSDPGSGLSGLALAYLGVGVGMGLMNPPITTTAVSALPPDRSGVAAGVTATSRQVGAVFGVATAGSILAYKAGTHAVHASPFSSSAAVLHASHLGYGVCAAAAALAGLVSVLTLRASPGSQIGYDGVDLESSSARANLTFGAGSSSYSWHDKCTEPETGSP